VTIVIAGALGHIGSKAIRQLPAAFPGAEIVMIDNMLTQRYCSLFNLPAEGNYRFIEGNVLSLDLDKIVEGADAVLQFAAITDAANSFKNKEIVEKNNFTATARIADACARKGCRLLHMSSTSVYGTQSTVVDESCSDEELSPQSPYAETKLKEEKYLQELGGKSDLRFIICRCGTIAGVSAGMRFHTAVNKFCWQAVMGRPLTVWRTALDQKRPYLDLDDAINAFVFIISNNLFDQRVYNVLTENLTVRDIIESIRRHIPEIDIDYVDSEIMNQLSYDVSNQRFVDKGFEFKGSIERRITETLDLLKALAAVDE